MRRFGGAHCRALMWTSELPSITAGNKSYICFQLAWYCTHRYWSPRHCKSHRFTVVGGLSWNTDTQAWTVVSTIPQYDWWESAAGLEHGSGIEVSRNTLCVSYGRLPSTPATLRTRKYPPGKNAMACARPEVVLAYQFRQRCVLRGCRVHTYFCCTAPLWDKTL